MLQTGEWLGEWELSSESVVINKEKENIMLEIIKNKAIEQFRSIYKENQEFDRTFKMLIPTGDDQLLILGIMNTRFKYDTCIAVLNPSEELIDKLEPGCAYTGNSLRKLVNGKCDVMVDLLIKTFKRRWEVRVMRSYGVRKP